MISEKEIAAMEINASSGSKMIKVSDRVHFFLSQLECFIHRGANFECLNSIEFECIVGIKKSIDNNKEDDLQKNRKPRKGIDLGKNHPLTDRGYKVFIMTKFCTLILGGNLILVCPKYDFDVLGTSE